MFEPLNRDEMEARRMAAASHLQTGSSQASVARMFNVSRTTAGRWERAVKYKGVDSLKRSYPTGRPCRLSKEQLALIPEILEQGPRVFGFPNYRWTAGRLAFAIEQRFGVHYHPDHVSRRWFPKSTRNRTSL